jgi:hypothetical protein
MLSNVVLPEPDDPTTATNSPRRMVSETSLNAGTATSPAW